MRYIKFGFDWPSDFREDMFEYYGNIQVFCHWLGAVEPLGSNVFQNHWYLVPEWILERGSVKIPLIL